MYNSHIALPPLSLLLKYCVLIPVGISAIPPLPVVEVIVIVLPVLVTVVAPLPLKVTISPLSISSDVRSPVASKYQLYVPLPVGGVAHVPSPLQ